VSKQKVNIKQKESQLARAYQGLNSFDKELVQHKLMNAFSISQRTFYRLLKPEAKISPAQEKKLRECLGLPIPKRLILKTK
jgi:hypothetical protein